MRQSVPLHWFVEDRLYRHYGKRHESPLSTRVSREMTDSTLLTWSLPRCVCISEHNQIIWLLVFDVIPLMTTIEV